jgi:hypothetical protein
MIYLLIYSLQIFLSTPLFLFINSRNKSASSHGSSKDCYQNKKKPTLPLALPLPLPLLRPLLLVVPTGIVTTMIIIIITITIEIMKITATTDTMTANRGLNQSHSQSIKRPLRLPPTHLGLTELSSMRPMSKTSS